MLYTESFDVLLGFDISLKLIHGHDFQYNKSLIHATSVKLIQFNLIRS